ncbi:MAG: RcnB family protein [Sphingomicrobium sp.]
MRKFILFGLMAATAVPAMAMAQARPELRQDRQEVRHDRQQLRHDRRELRREHRDARRIRYVSPYRGWTYRVITPGYQLRPGFYGQRYVITNYGHYQLRAPGRFQRWVRYGDDLVLVNVRTGRVLKVIRNRY